MKAIVEHYAKGEFQVDRPEVAISEKFFKTEYRIGNFVRRCLHGEQHE